MDLSKAFDTVNYNIFSIKLEHYGVHGIALDWIKISLSNRFQFVQFKTSISSLEPTICGVPCTTGNIWPPIVLSIY